MTKSEMEPVIINAFDLNQCWYEVIKACLEKGYERPVFRGARKEQRRKELDSVFINVKHPSNRPLVPDVPQGVPTPTSVKYVNSYLMSLITPFKQEWEKYTYGERIAGKLGVPDDYGKGTNRNKKMSRIDEIEGQRMSSLDISQFEKIREFLKDTPETNRSIIEVGKPEDLLITDPPCMRLLQFKVRYGKMHMWVYFRSWDAWGGLPANLAALQLVKEFLAKENNVEDGEMYAMSAGLHLYSGEWELAKQVVKHRGGVTRVGLEKSS